MRYRCSLTKPPRVLEAHLRNIVSLWRALVKFALLDAVSSFARAEAIGLRRHEMTVEEVVQVVGESPKIEQPSVRLKKEFLPREILALALI